jgi:chromosome segregation ATPase
MLRITLSVLALVASFAAVLPASAAESARCADVLDEAALARAALEQMEEALAEAKADRAMLAERADALALEIAELRATAPTSAKIVELQAERREVLREIAGADSMIPDLQRQVEGLRAAVEQAERGYIACVEASL